MIRVSPHARRSALALAIALALILGAPVGFAATSRSDPAAVGSPAPAASQRAGPDLAMLALGMVGVRYAPGGSTPVAGLDCSGLVRYVFEQVTGTTLPRTAREMARLGQRVAAAELQAGDLVFFNTRAAFSHVGIYLGENRFVHAPSPGRAVEIVTLSERYWRERYSGARRLLALPGAKVAAAAAPE